MSAARPVPSVAVTTSDEGNPMTTTAVPRRRLARVVSAAVAILTVATALVAAQAAPALAGPNDPMTSGVATLCTGNDDKRQDSLVALDVDTTQGTVRIILSPDHQNIRLGDRTCAQIPVNLFPIVPSTITGFRLEWVRGRTDGMYDDSWEFTGLTVTGINKAFEVVQLIDASGVKHKFDGDEILPLVAPVGLNGSFDGTVTPPNQGPAPIHVTFASFGGLVTGTATLPGMLLLNVCNMDIAIPPVMVTLTGQRDSVDASGDSHYTLSAPLAIGNFMVHLVATLTVSPDGRVVSGTITITDLPWPCGGPEIRIDLTKTR